MSQPSRSNLGAYYYLLKLCENSLPLETDPLSQMASPACCSLQCLSVKRVALFLLLVSVYASLFVSRLSDAGQVADRRDSSGGKRALLGLDEEVEEDPLPKKKKSLVSIKEGEETKVLKKKKVDAGTEGSEEEKPKKKKATVQDLEEENVTKKKKKFAAADEDHVDGDEVPLKKNKKAITKSEESDGDEEVPLKKNKKATTKTEAEVDDDQLPKKNKKGAIDEEEEDQATQMEKKKPTLEELDRPKKKFTSQEEAAADTEEKPLKKKKKIASNMVDNEEVEEQSLKKKKLAPMGDNEEEVEEHSLTKKKKLAEVKTGKLAKPKNQTKPIKPTTNSTIKPAKPKAKLTTPKPREEVEDGDLITEFRELPSKLATSIIPDLERISTTSKVYLKKANKEISQGFKPLVGPKYASLIASFASYLFLLAPIVIFPLLYARIRNYFLPLQTILVFIHIYLAIYFSVLSLSYLVTGQEPLRFFYSTSKASFVYTQLLQTMGYALYLLVLVVHLVVVFSSKDAGAAPRAVGLAQMMVGLAVGAHYYVAVAHRAVLREPPLTNWKVHAGYAALFVGVCLLARAERRKKAYLHEAGEDGKTS